MIFIFHDRLTVMMIIILYISKNAEAILNVYAKSHLTQTVASAGNADNQCAKFHVDKH